MVTVQDVLKTFPGSEIMGYDNTNKGALFRNDRRENENQPSHTGTINVEGVEYQLSAWVKESTKTPGRKFFSLSVKKK